MANVDKGSGSKGGKSVGADGGTPAFSSGKKTSAEATEQTKNVDFAKGGDTHMFGSGDHTKTASGEQAGEQTPGQTAKDNAGGSGDKFAKGGSGKMFGFTGALPATEGISAARKS
jgi:hypothetical protein